MIVCYLDSIKREMVGVLSVGRLRILSKFLEDIIGKRL